MQDNFDIAHKNSFPEKYSNADGKFLSWLEKIFGVGTGSRKACKDSGLTGVEKRACAKKLRASGWKKGDPIPDDMTGLTQEEAGSIYVPPSQEPPMPTEIYQSPYTANTY